MSSGSRSRGYVGTLSEERAFELMAYADGELEGTEREAVERWIATDVDAARFVRELATLGDLVEEGHRGSSEAKAVASFDVADAVMAAVSAEKAGRNGRSPASLDGEGRTALEQGGARTAAVTASLESEGRTMSKPAEGVRTAVTSLDAARARRQKNVRTGGVVAAALALAASVLVMTRHKDDRPMAMAPPAVQSPASTEPGVDVDLVEGAGDSVRVFYLSNESSPTTSVVVWVDESGGR